MGKVVKWGAIGLGVALLLCQLYRPEKTNPPVDPAKRAEAHLQFTPEAREIVEKACRDCHTHETRWPWYSHVAPASWLVVSDVDHAREHLNFSEWADYDAEQAEKMLEEICEEVEEGGMPLPIYVPLHPEADLTAQEREAVCAWTRAERARLKDSEP